MRQTVPADPARDGDPALRQLAERATFALRNHLGGLMALSHVLELDNPGDDEAVAALRDTIARLALDADVLADLSTVAVAWPPDPVPLRHLLQEAIGPLAWLADLLGTPLGVVCPSEPVAGFLEPREVVVIGRRLVAGLIAAGVAEPIVLEARRTRRGVMVAARRQRDELDCARLARPAPNTNHNDLHMELLGWTLGRPGLRSRLLAQPGSVLAVELAPRSEVNPAPGGVVA